MIADCSSADFLKSEWLMCSEKQINASMPLPREDVPYRKILLYDLLSCVMLMDCIIVGFQPQLWS